MNSDGQDELAKSRSGEMRVSGRRAAGAKVLRWEGVLWVPEAGKKSLWLEWGNHEGRM